PADAASQSAHGAQPRRPGAVPPRRPSVPAAGTARSHEWQPPRHRLAAPRPRARPGTARPGVGRAAFARFGEQLLGRLPLQIPLRQYALESGGLALQLPQARRFGTGPVAVFLAPPRARRLRTAVRPAARRTRLLPPFRLLQDADELLLADLPRFPAVPPDACPLGRTLTHPMA